MNILLNWLIFMMLFLAIGYILGARNRSAARRDDEASETPAVGAETLADFQQRVTPVLAVEGHQMHAGGVLFDGKLRTDPQSALSQLTRSFWPEKFTPILEEGERSGKVKVALLPGDQRISRPVGGSRAAKLAAPFSALWADAGDHDVGRRVACRR